MHACDCLSSVENDKKSAAKQQNRFDKPTDKPTQNMHQPAKCSRMLHGVRLVITSSIEASGLPPLSAPVHHHFSSHGFAREAGNVMFGRSFTRKQARCLPTLGLGWHVKNFRALDFVGHDDCNDDLGGLD